MVDDAKAGDVAANGATEADCVEMRGARRTAADEAIGYWGQKIVLAAQDMELQYVLVRAVLAQEIARRCGAGEENSPDHCGWPRKTQGFSRKTKSVEALSSVECAKAPAWFAAAMEAAQLAPTAMNNQNFKITLLSDGKTVRIDAPQSGLNVIDEGIVRCNFEIAANEAGARLALGARYLGSDGRLF